MTTRLFVISAPLVLLLAVASGCSQGEGVAHAALDPGATPPSPAAPTPAATVSSQAPPPAPAPAVPPDRTARAERADIRLRPPALPADVDVRAEVRVEEGRGQAGASVSLQGGAGGIGSGLRPVHAPAGGHVTCRSALLAAGHPTSSLIHCEDAEPRCAVALLRAGHGPAQLVHCEDVGDVRCAVRLLRSGRAPAEIVHCD